MSKAHKRGSDYVPPYVQMIKHNMTLPAWRSLSPYARCLYLEIKGRYNGSNNGDISYSYREAQDALGCSNKPIPGAFRELQERGWIVAMQKGSFSWKRRTDTGTLRATTWRLTELAQDVPTRVAGATHDYKKWQPEEKTRHAESVPYARPKRAVSGKTARRERVNDTLKAGHLAPVSDRDGTLKAGTYILPDATPGNGAGDIRPDARRPQSASAVGPSPVGSASAALLDNMKKRGWAS